MLGWGVQRLGVTTFQEWGVTWMVCWCGGWCGGGTTWSVWRHDIVSVTARHGRCDGHDMADVMAQRGWRDGATRRRCDGTTLVLLQHGPDNSRPLSTALCGVWQLRSYCGYMSVTLRRSRDSFPAPNGICWVVCTNFPATPQRLWIVFVGNKFGFEKEFSEIDRNWKIYILEKMEKMEKMEKIGENEISWKNWKKLQKS